MKYLNAFLKGAWDEPSKDISSSEEKPAKPAKGLLQVLQVGDPKLSETSREKEMPGDLFTSSFEAICTRLRNNFDIWSTSCYKDSILALIDRINDAWLSWDFQIFENVTKEIDRLISDALSDDFKT